MLVAFNWELRPHLHELQGAKLSVLLALVLRANKRMRCWPSIDVLCKDTGYSRKPVEDAKAWLVVRGAIELVTYDKRLEDEEMLPPRQHVYQITGSMKTESGEIVSYLVMDKSNSSEIKRSENESSKSERKVNTTVKDNSNKRSRNAIFDAFGKHLFEISLEDQAQVKAHKGRIVALKKKIKDMYPDTPDDVLAAKIASFPDWYHAQPDTKNATLPLGEDKFPGYFSKMMANGHGDPADWTEDHHPDPEDLRKHPSKSWLITGYIRAYQVTQDKWWTVFKRDPAELWTNIRHAWEKDSSARQRLQELAPQIEMRLKETTC